MIVQSNWWRYLLRKTGLLDLITQRHNSTMLFLGSAKEGILVHSPVLLSFMLLFIYFVYFSPLVIEITVQLTLSIYMETNSFR